MVDGHLLGGVREVAGDHLAIDGIGDGDRSAPGDEAEVAHVLQQDHALASRNDDDPTDYLDAGWWLRFPGRPAVKLGEYDAGWSPLSIARDAIIGERAPDPERARRRHARAPAAYNGRDRRRCSPRRDGGSVGSMARRIARLAGEGP